MFLIMQDPTGKRPHETIREGIARHVERFGSPPALCLVAEGRAIPDPPMPLTPRREIARNVYYLGDYDREVGDAAAR